jgi:hypothetical protein
MILALGIVSGRWQIQCDSGKIYCIRTLDDRIWQLIDPMCDFRRRFPSELQAGEFLREQCRKTGNVWPEREKMDRFIWLPSEEKYIHSNLLNEGYLRTENGDVLFFDGLFLPRKIAVRIGRFPAAAAREVVKYLRRAMALRQEADDLERDVRFALVFYGLNGGWPS